jgi:hypothetical protein
VLNDGNRTFTRAQQEEMWGGPESVRALDVVDANGDGRPDLLFLDANLNALVFMAGDGAPDGDPITCEWRNGRGELVSTECSNCAVSGWGWRDDGYGAPGIASSTVLRFPRGACKPSASRLARTASRSIKSCCRRENTSRRVPVR